MPIGTTFLLEFWLGSLREHGLQGGGIDRCANNRFPDAPQAVRLPRPFDLSKLAAFRRDIQVAELDDAHLVALDWRGERNRAARKVDTVDDSESQALACCIGEAAKEIPFKAQGQKFAIRGRRDRRADD